MSSIRLNLFFSYLVLCSWATAESVFIHLYGATVNGNHLNLESSEAIREAEIEERDGKLLLTLKQPLELESAFGQTTLIERILVSNGKSVKMIQDLAPLTTHRVLMQKTEVRVPDDEGQKMARASLVEVSQPGDKSRSYQLPGGQILSEGMVDYFISTITKPLEVELPWKVSYLILDSVDLGTSTGGTVEFENVPRIMTKLVVTPEGGTSYRGESRSLSRGGEDISKVLKFTQRELTDPVVQERIRDFRSGQLRADKNRESVVSRLMKEEGGDGRSNWRPRGCNESLREIGLGH